MWVKPTSDPTRAIVRDPTTGAELPVSGKKVSDNDFYWLRRLDQDDVVLGVDPASVSPQSTVTSGGTSTPITSGANVSSGGSVTSGGSAA